MHAHLTLSTLDCQQIHSKYTPAHTHTELTVIVCVTVRRAKRRTCFQSYLEADEAQLSHIIYHAVAIASLFVSHIFISPGHALCFGDNNNHSRGKQTRVKYQLKRRQVGEGKTVGRPRGQLELFCQSVCVTHIFCQGIKVTSLLKGLSSSRIRERERKIE